MQSILTRKKFPYQPLKQKIHKNTPFQTKHVSPNLQKLQSCKASCGSILHFLRFSMRKSNGSLDLWIGFGLFPVLLTWSRVPKAVGELVDGGSACLLACLLCFCLRLGTFFAQTLGRSARDGDSVGPFQLRNMRNLRDSPPQRPKLRSFEFWAPNSSGSATRESVGLSVRSN